MIENHIFVIEKSNSYNILQMFFDFVIDVLIKTSILALKQKQKFPFIFDPGIIRASRTNVFDPKVDFVRNALFVFLLFGLWGRLFLVKLQDGIPRILCSRRGSRVKMVVFDKNIGFV